MNNRKLAADEELASRLVLGTAQLGMRYGIANRSGRPDASQGRAIVEAAWEAGIRTFDTARGYGESELVLGRALADLNLSHEAKIITKISPPSNPSDRDALRKIVAESLDRLGVPGVYGLLWHSEQILDVLNEGIRAAMADVVRDGMAEHWGVSVYTPARALRAIETGTFDLLQVPANVLDRRLAEAGVFERARERDIRIYIRSVFLQGFLLLDPETIPELMSFALPVLKSLEEISDEIGLSRREIALQYVKARFPYASVIFGAETAQQVQENADAWSAAPMIDSRVKRLEGVFACVDTSIVDPSKWPREK
jgi:aryl-alcohol dehydrogenase-like predicted oxidoreductase